MDSTKKPSGRGAHNKPIGEANLKTVKTWVDNNPGGTNIMCQRATGLSYYIVARCFGIIFK